MNCFQFFLTVDIYILAEISLIGRNSILVHHLGGEDTICVHIEHKELTVEFYLKTKFRNKN